MCQRTDNGVHGGERPKSQFGKGLAAAVMQILHVTWVTITLPQEGLAGKVREKKRTW